MYFVFFTIVASTNSKRINVRSSTTVLVLSVCGLRLRDFWPNQKSQVVCHFTKVRGAQAVKKFVISPRYVGHRRCVNEPLQERQAGGALGLWGLPAGHRHLRVVGVAVPSEPVSPRGGDVVVFLMLLPLPSVLSLEPKHQSRLYSTFYGRNAFVCRCSS